MAKADKKIAKQLTRKKKWYLILSPKFLGEKPIGETYLYDAGDATNRLIQVNLMQLTGDVKNQNSDVKFIITGVRENKLDTQIIGYVFSSATVKRFVRRRMTRIDESMVVKTKDDIRLRVKPFLLTKQKVSRNIEYSLRAIVKDELMNWIKKTNYEDVFTSVLRYQVQKELREKLSKLYPVRNLEIRILEKENQDIPETAPPKKVPKLIVGESEEEPKKKKKKEPKETELEVIPE